METTFLVTKLIRDQRTYIATALYQERKLLEISLDSQQEESILGNIYVGRVKDIVKNLNAAFIEIAPGVPCYYGLENLKNPLYVKKINSPRMVQGDEVVVQVVREKSKGKPPRVSTNLTFTGKYLVLTSENTTVGFSKKLDFETKNRLKSALNFEKMREFGVIVRTNAAFASIDEILAEYSNNPNLDKKAMRIVLLNLCLNQKELYRMKIEKIFEEDGTKDEKWVINPKEYNYKDFSINWLKHYNAPLIRKLSENKDINKSIRNCFIEAYGERKLDSELMDIYFHYFAK